MSIWKPLRKLFIKPTDFTHGYQGENKKILNFYKLWAYCYDFSVGLDPAFNREMKVMIDSVVQAEDTVLDIGCGTGIGTIYAAGIVKEVIGIDISADMINKLKKKIKRKNMNNIKLINGSFPESLPGKTKFNSIFSSFAIAHFTVEKRKAVYRQIFNILLKKGKLGLFLAQGEIASTFETKDEILSNLHAAGFKKIESEDVSDIYRIVKAEKI